MDVRRNKIHNLCFAIKDEISYKERFDELCAEIDQLLKEFEQVSLRVKEMEEKYELQED